MSNEPDVVLMDVNLEGGREGIEAARWLREVCDTAVVFVTSYNDDDTVERIPTGQLRIPRTLEDTAEDAGLDAEVRFIPHSGRIMRSG